MEHKQFISDELNLSPHTNQCFQIDRYSKTNFLNIPDTIPENSSGELSGDNLKMEAPKITLERSNYEDKENFCDNPQVKCNESSNASLSNAIDKSYIKECEKKLLESSIEEEKNTDHDERLVNQKPIKLLRNLYSNDTISTPPSMLRKEISILRNEMAEAHEFHDWEIRFLQEEKFMTDADSNNYLELFEKYSALMELYTTLKTEYEEYRKEQEKIKHELQSKTADCLESLCSQIETSDNSMNFSSASFVSFTGSIRSSTMMADMSEVEATVIQDATVLENDPLSITTDGRFGTPFRSAKKLFPQELNLSLGKPIVKEVKETIVNPNAAVHLDSEYNLRLLNLETALYEKVKEVEDLEQRLFKVEDLSVVLQNEFERITSVYSKENKTLKESLAKKTEQFNELTEKLFTEIVSLNPAVQNSLVDIPESKLLVVFMETIMESCKKIQEEQSIKHNGEKTEWETRIKNLQSELEDLKKSYKDLEKKLADAEKTILTRDEEIHLLESHLSNVRQTREDFALALSEVETRLTLAEAEKTAAENRFRDLESVVENLKREMQSEMQAKTIQFESENSQLKELCDSLRAEIKSNEMRMGTIREKLTSAEETILKLQTKIQSLEAEKSELEEVSQNLRNESTKANNLEEIPAYKEAQTLIDNLKHRISESEKTVAALTEELETSQLRNASEINSLIAENSSLTKALNVIEDFQNSLLNELLNGSDVFCERLTKLTENLQVTREHKIMSIFSQTIKGFQTELTKKYDTESATNLNLINSLRHKIIEQETRFTEKEELINSLRKDIENSEKLIAECNEEIKILKFQEVSLKQSKDDLDEVIMKLKSQLQDSTIQNQQWKIQIDEELGELKIVRDKVETENGHLKRQVEESEEVIVDLKRRLEIAEDERNIKETRIQELKVEMDSLKNDLESLLEKLKTVETSNKNLTDVLFEIQSQLGMPENALTELLADDFKNKKIFNERINNFIKSELSRQETNQLELDESRKACENLRENLTTAQNTITAREDEIRVLQSNMKQIQDNLTDVKHTLGDLVSRLSACETEKTETEKRYRELEAVVEELKREIEKKEHLEIHLSSIEKKKMEIESDNIRLKDLCDNLKAQIAEAENLISQREKEIKILKSTESELRNSLEAKMTEAIVREEEIRILRSEIKTIQESLSGELTIEKTEAEKRCKELESIIENLKGEICEMENIQEKFNAQKLENDALKDKMVEAENLLITRDEEIRILKSTDSELRKCLSLVENSISAKEEQIQILQTDIKHSQETLTNQKIEAENRHKELEELIENLKREIDEMENIQKELKTQKLENGYLKDKMVESYESELATFKQNLLSADETIKTLQSQLKSVEVEKCEMENRCTELQENNQNLKVEVVAARNNPAYEQIQTENVDLKQRIFESEKMMAELKSELELAKEDQMNNIRKVEELIREIEELKKENSGFSHALVTIEETQRNLADVLSNVANDSDLPGDRITKMIEKTSKLSETWETKIVSDLVETITKTCKGVQNELVKKFDNKKLEWETQRDVDLRNLQDRINFLTDKNDQLEVIIKQTKEDLAAADKTVLKLKSQLSLAEKEKLEIELRCRKLEESVVSFQAEIDTKETIIKGLDELKFVREKVETENFVLKQRILESEEIIIRLKKSLEDVQEERNSKDVKIQDLVTEIESLKREQLGLNKLSEKLQNLEKSNKKLLDVVSDVQSHLNMPEDALTKLLSGNLENKKILSEKINSFTQNQMEGLKAENRNLKVGNENLKGKVKQLVKLIGESANSELKEEVSNLNISQPIGTNLRSKSGKNIDLCVRRIDKLEEINHNLTELLTRVLTMTEFQDLEKLRFCSVRDFPNITKKVVAHMNALQSRMKELKDENSQLDEECETYAKIIKDLKKEAATVWKSNKEKTEALEAEINRLKDEKSHLEAEKEDLLSKISKLTNEYQKLKSASKTEGALHACVCGNESKKINELKRVILVKEQKILELQDLEAKSTSYKSQIEYLKTALEREKKRTGEEKEKNKKLQNELSEATKNRKTESKGTDENQMLDELRMRGSISGGIVQEFVDKEKMRKLSKDIGILKELCRARYAEIKRLEAVNAALRNTQKNSNQMDSPIRSKGYNTRSKNQMRDLFKTEIIGKENSAS